MVKFTGAGPEATKVSTTELQARSSPDDRSDNAHRQLIGYIGLLLPMVLIIIVLIRDGAEAWTKLDSISAYYYTGAVAAFVGMLVSLALFLFTYRGFENRYQKYDRWTARVAAIAAVLVAFFPTKAPAGAVALSWWAPVTGVLHYVGAVVLFSMFAVFALLLFRRTADGAQASIEPGEVAAKKQRNFIYLVCGVLIVFAMAWAGYNGFNDKSIFWPESLALAAFAVSWLVKGYAHRSIRKMFAGK
jgi:NADH:ubiquinone oxidoreductase subunit 6 (subunit J)